MSFWDEFHSANPGPALRRVWDETIKKFTAVKGTNGATHQYATELREGEMTLADMRVTAPVWKKIRVTASGVVAGLTAGNVIGGFIVQTSTALTLTAYDDTVATDATKVIVPVTAALAVGQLVSPFGGGVGPVTVANMPSAGMLLTTGLYLTVGGSGSAWVLYR